MTLTQEGQKLNFDDEEHEHADSPGLSQQPKPTLNQTQFQNMQDGRPSIDSTPKPPIQEMVNIESQYNKSATQALMEE